MERDLEIDGSLVIPGAELRFSASRASGPGGQHVNKTSTAVTLEWDVSSTSVLDAEGRARLRGRLGRRISRAGVLRVRVVDERSQHRNRTRARERLAGIVRAALAEPRPRRPTRPTRAARERRVADKRHRSAIKKLRTGRPEE